MGVTITLGLIGIIVAIIIGVMASFPVPIDEVIPFDPNAGIDESFSEEKVGPAGALFVNSYTKVIDEVVSFQTDPDYVRADVRRQEFIGLADAYGVSLQEIKVRLVGDIGQLASEIEAAAITP